MLLEAIGGRGLVILGGKGGVGKTTLAASLALACVRRGERVLLVSTDPAHNLGHIFDRPVGPKPVRVAPGLDAIEIDPAACATEHLRRVSGLLHRLTPDHLHGEMHRHLERSRHAPGMEEAALLERLAGLAGTVGTADGPQRLICDTAPTGHALSLLAMPELMAAWTDGMLANRDEADRFGRKARALSGAREGPAEARDAEIREVLMRRRVLLSAFSKQLCDREACGFVIVATAERMPALETVALKRSLAEAHIATPALVVNRLRGGARAEAETAAMKILREAAGEAPVFTTPETESEPIGTDALDALWRSLQPA
ncbi:MAG: ArsA family ATPase [Tropicimonas sp.]|uniref:ArsA family ATPase n=1 Tax=Tropicimonas sp. TaxID=2067044 RepID=UPI003A8851A5